MPNEPIPLAQNTADELDEILVKEPDGTFRVVKVVPPITNPPAGGVVTGQAGQVSSKPVVPALPRVEKPAPVTMALDIEEEKELTAVREKTKTIAPKMDDASVAIARRAIAESGVALSDPSLASRLLAVLVAAVKEVRKELETRDLLMRGKEQGGLAMTMNEATRLLALLKPPVVSKPVPPPPPKLVVSSPPPPVTPKPVPPPPKPVAPIPPPTKPSAPPPQQVMRPPTPTKSVVQDVSFTPKLVGPIDELQMNLAEWRRMAPTLKDRGTKIEEKLRLLEEGSYADRLKGVAAWYASDVVRLYQDAGRESLASGKPIAAVLADREAKGLPTLTLEEFQSVADLNEKLRF